MRRTGISRTRWSTPSGRERPWCASARELVAATEPQGWAPFRDLDTPGASHHIVSLRHRTLSAAAVQARLADERRIVVSARGGGIRVSLHLYNDSEDIAVLANALAETGR